MQLPHDLKQWHKYFVFYRFPMNPINFNKNELIKSSDDAFDGKWILRSIWDQSI